MFGQQYATTGDRRLKPDYTADINARTPYLQNLYNLKADNEYRDKAFAQDKKQFNLTYQQNQDALEDQKKRNKLATGISLGTLGVNTGLGLMNSGWFDDWGGSAASDVAGSAVSYAPSFLTESVSDFGGNDLWDMSSASDYVSEPVASFASDLGESIYETASDWVGELL